MFVEKYAYAVNTSDLRDDEHHHATDALAAAALADLTGSDAVLGSLLCRAKYASPARKTFESGCGNLAELSKVWRAEVAKRGQERRWCPSNTAWDIEASFRIYELVANLSLAHWLDPHCGLCKGSKVGADRRTCTCCGGTGRGEIEGGRFIVDKAKDMVSELEGIYQAHSIRAARKLRRAA